MGWTAKGPRFSATLSAGLALVHLRAELPGDFQVHETYPYDEAAVSNLVLREASGRDLGFGAGAAVHYRVVSRLGVGARLRYVHATVDLADGLGGTAPVEAGAFRAGFDLELGF